MPRQNVRSLTPISQQLNNDALRIDAVLDSFVVPPAKITEKPVPNQPLVEAEPRPANADRKPQNAARRTRRG